MSAEQIVRVAQDTDRLQAWADRVEEALASGYRRRFPELCGWHTLAAPLSRLLILPDGRTLSTLEVIGAEEWPGMLPLEISRYAFRHDRECVQDEAGRWVCRERCRRRYEDALRCGHVDQPGWIDDDTLRCDYVAFLWLKSARMRIYPFRELQGAYRSNRREWGRNKAFQHKPICVLGFEQRFLYVPADKVRSAIDAQYEVGLSPVAGEESVTCLRVV